MASTSNRAIRILGLAGSLREQSYNRLLLQAAKRLAPAGVVIKVYSGLGGVPLLNADDLADGVPSGVKALRDAVNAADGVLIATPEYNHSIPGVLKNALDWMSLDVAGAPFVGKPVAILGATPGQWGTRYAQAALRQVLSAMEATVMPAPMVFLKSAQQIFGEGNVLSDKEARASLTSLLQSFRSWVGALDVKRRPMRAAA